MKNRNRVHSTKCTNKPPDVLRDTKNSKNRKKWPRSTLPTTNMYFVTHPKNPQIT